MTPLFVSWVVVTLIMMVLFIVRKRLESREQDWLPLATTTNSEIQAQEQIEKKVHVLTPVLHWVEALDVVLLLALGALWIYHGINTVQW